jgi:hypothetical protein
MSYIEYENLRTKANKENTLYSLYTLDGKGSERREYKNGEEDFAFRTIDLVNEMTRLFLDIEKKENKLILVRDSEVCLCKDCRNMASKDFLCLNNPNFTCGDFVSFYFYNSNMSNELFYRVFYQAAKNVKDNFTYHFAKQNYETNNYGESNKKYWMGHAQQFLNSNKQKRIRDLNVKDLVEQIKN